MFIARHILLGDLRARGRGDGHPQAILTIAGPAHEFYHANPSYTMD